MSIKVCGNNVNLSRLDAAKHAFHTQGFSSSLCAFFKGGVITLLEANTYSKTYNITNLHKKLQGYTVRIHEEQKNVENLDKNNHWEHKLLIDNQALELENKLLTLNNNKLKEMKAKINTFEALKHSKVYMARLIEEKNKKLSLINQRITNILNSPLP